MNESMRSVTIARQIDRPSAKQFIDEMFDDFLEFHGDRLFGDDGAIVGGIAALNGMPVTVVGHLLLPWGIRYGCSSMQCIRFCLRRDFPVSCGRILPEWLRQPSV